MRPGEIVDQMLELFVLANLVLGLFNLLPLPPLDGGRIVVGILPEPLAVGVGAAGAGRDRPGAAAACSCCRGCWRSMGIRFDPVGQRAEHGRALGDAISSIGLAGWHG